MLQVAIEDKILEEHSTRRDDCGNCLVIHNDPYRLKNTSPNRQYITQKVHLPPDTLLESAPSASLYSSLHPHSSSVIHRKPFSTGVRKTVFSCWREPGELTDKLPTNEKSDLAGSLDSNWVDVQRI
jgi:hypothetical protein